MTEKSRNLIKEHLLFLPKESQEAIVSFDWENKAEEIGKKYFSMEDDISKLQAEIGIVLVGLEDQDMLPSNIESVLGMNREKAEEIGKEIIQKILKPIVETLSKKIKFDLKNRPTHWQQNLDFILSGGDYTSFISEGMIKEENELPKPNTSFNPSKIEDLKSKFTI